MTLQEAIMLRHSVRRYVHKPLSAEIVETLRKKIEECNAEGGLHIQLVTNETRAFTGLFSYGKFSGVENYIVMVGRKADNLDERVGYYGEQLVLLAQTLGLNTCWAGLSYRRVDEAYSVGNDEKLTCMIALGYGATQGHKRKSKTAEQVSNVGSDSPEWFRKGVEAVLMAPTAEVLLHSLAARARHRRETEGSCQARLLNGGLHQDGPRHSPTALRNRSRNGKLRLGVTSFYIKKTIMKTLPYIVFSFIMLCALCTSINSYNRTENMIAQDVNRALEQVLTKMPDNVVTTDTIRCYRNCLTIAELKDTAGIAMRTVRRDGRWETKMVAEANCGFAATFMMSDQKASGSLMFVGMMWLLGSLWYVKRKRPELVAQGLAYGGIVLNGDKFMTLSGEQIRLTPMQHSLLEMFMLTDTHTLSKQEICDRLWPKKPDASDTLYTLVRRIKPIIEAHSRLKIESDRGKSYSLKLK